MKELASSPVKKEDSKYDEYAVKCAADDLMRAEEYKQDKKMMGLVKEHLQKKQRAITSSINSVADLRARKKELDEEESENE